MKHRLKRLAMPRGAAMLKSIFIMLILVVLMAFLFQIFVIYSTANSVRIAVRDSAFAIAAANKPKLFASLREGNTFLQSENLTDGENALLTVDEMSQKLSEMLGMELSENDLVKRGESSVSYAIRELRITLEDPYSLSGGQTLSFVTELVLEVPVAAFWNFGTIRIPMEVRSKYTAKF